MKSCQLLCILLLAIFCLIFCAQFLFPVNKIISEDSYLQYCAYSDINVTAFIKDHRIPFWAYHFGGGYPIIKHPDVISLSPFFLFFLVFGSAGGIKLFIVSSYIIGAIGFFIFVRRILGCGLVASTITSMFFVFNSFMPFLINTGSATKELNWFYLPLITYTLYLSKASRRFIFYCSCLIALIILNGFSLNLPTLVLFLFMVVFIDAITLPKNRLVNQKLLFVNFGIIIAIAFLLAALKIFPLFELLKFNLREIDDYQRAILGPSATPMTISRMFLAFFSKGPYADGNEAIMGQSGLGMAFVSYLGSIPAVLFILAAVFNFKKVWKIILIIILFLGVSMANNFPIDLFHILWRLPLFHSMQDIVPYFIFPVVFLIPVVIGYFFVSEFFVRLNNKVRFLIYAVAFIGVLNMFVANQKYYKFAAAYNIDVPAMKMGNDFFNVESVIVDDSMRNSRSFDSSRMVGGKEEGDLYWGQQYFLFRQNIGLVNWSDELSLENHAVAKYKVMLGYGGYWKDFRAALLGNNGIIMNKDYKGEAYFMLHPENKANNIQWNTNEIVIDIDQIKPDRLVINQNYDASWGSDLGKVHNANGLIAVELDKPLKGKIKLTYWLKSFYIGLIISLITLIICLIYFFKDGKDSIEN